MQQGPWAEVTYTGASQSSYKGAVGTRSSLKPVRFQQLTAKRTNSPLQDPPVTAGARQGSREKTPALLNGKVTEREGGGWGVVCGTLPGPISFLMNTQVRNSSERPVSMSILRVPGSEMC